MARTVIDPANGFKDLGRPGYCVYEIDKDDNALTAVETVMCTVPAGSTFRIFANVLAVFNSGTSESLRVGDGSTADKYMAAGDLNERATGLTAVKGPYYVAADTAITADFIRVGAAPTTGQVQFTIEVNPS